MFEQNMNQNQCRCFQCWRVFVCLPPNFMFSSPAVSRSSGDTVNNCQVSTCRRLRPAASWLISTPRSHCHVPINLCVCRTPPHYTLHSPHPQRLPVTLTCDSEEQVHPLVCFWRLLCACVLSYMHLDSWCTSWYKPTESLLFQEEKWKTCPAVKFWWSLMLFRSLRRL